MKNKFFLLSIFMMFATSVSFADNLKVVNLEKSIKTPAQLKWGNPHLFAKGAHDSFLYSSPNNGPYTVRVKFLLILRLCLFIKPV